MRQRLEDRVAVVTGASSGIGAALAVELARRGADVALAARRVDRLEDTARRIVALGRRAVAAACDVRRDDEVEAVFERTRSELGRPSLVVANAGFGVGGAFEGLEVDDFRRQFDTNFLGVVRTARAALPDLIETRGCLGMMGSVAGMVGLPGSSAYGASKAAVHSLAGSLRAELAARGVAVVLLAPGFVESEIRTVDNMGRHRSQWRDPVPSWLRLSTDAAARRMVGALVRRRRLRVITIHGHVVAWLARLTPGALAAVLAHVGGRGRGGRRPAPSA